MPQGVSPEQAYMQMVRNPSMANLAYGPLNGEIESGYLMRLTLRYQLHKTAARKNGYIVWFPDFHNGGFTTGTDDYPSVATGRGGNLFVWEDGSTTSRPVNSTLGTGGSQTVFPYGYGMAVGTASCLVDPAFKFCNTETVSQARTLAASMTWQYTGQLSTVQGMMSKVEGVTLAQLLYGGEGLNTPVSIEELASMSQSQGRIGTGKYELKHHPSTMNSIYRNTDIPYIGSANTANDTGICLKAGAATVTPGPPPTASATAPSIILVESSKVTGIGFTWVGVGDSDSDIHIQCTKIIEWTPQATNNATIATAISRPIMTTDQIITHMDNNHHSWASTNSSPEGMTATMKAAANGQAGVAGR